MQKLNPEDLSQLNTLMRVVSDNAKTKGFRDQMFEGLTEEQAKGRPGQLIVAATFTANQHGESSELWEAFRAGKLNQLCDKADKMRAAGLEPLTCAEEEIADVLIRALDNAEILGIDPAKAVATKHNYNLTRPALHGGKRA